MQEDVTFLAGLLHRGLRARGGLSLDFAWKDGAICALTVTSLRAQRLELVLGQATRHVDLSRGQQQIV